MMTDIKMDEGNRTVRTLPSPVESLKVIADFAEIRIKDGADLGAHIWRIALEDIVREARAVLLLREVEHE